MTGQETFEQLDRSIPIPLYFQLENRILEDIRTGKYPIGNKLPTENELKEMYSVSRATVRQAVNELVQKGWVERNGNKGTFVTSPKQKLVNVHTSEPFNDQIRRAGMHPMTEVLELKIVTADRHIAQLLEIKERERVIYMLRRRFVDQTAIVTMENYLPYGKCSFVLDHDFTRESLNEVLHQQEQTKPVIVKQTAEAQIANRKDICYFGIDKAIPVMHVLSYDRNAYGEIVSYNVQRYRGDYVKLEVELNDGVMSRIFNPPDTDGNKTERVG